jgi:hypothetical protein
MNWDQMTGDSRARFCSLCSLHVYSIAELTRKQAVALISETEGRICARIYRRSDGTVITKDCPVGLRAIRRRVALVTGAVFATVVTLSSAVLGQKPNKTEDPACQQQVTISKKTSDSDVGAITGTVLDPQRSMVVGAKITVRNLKSGKSLEVTSNDEGRFRVVAPEAGDYEVIAESPGFLKLEVAQLTIAPKESVNLTVILSYEVLTGVVDVLPMRQAPEPPMTRTINRDIMQRLPVP